MTPSHHPTVSQNGRKCTFGRINVAYAASFLQFSLYVSVVASTERITPSDDATITENRSEGVRCRIYMFNSAAAATSAAAAAANTVTNSTTSTCWQKCPLQLGPASTTTVCAQAVPPSYDPIVLKNDRKRTARASPAPGPEEPGRQGLDEQDFGPVLNALSRPTFVWQEHLAALRQQPQEDVFLRLMFLQVLEEESDVVVAVDVDGFRFAREGPAKLQPHFLLKQDEDDDDDHDSFDYV